MNEWTNKELKYIGKGPWAYLEGAAGAAPNRKFFAPFKYSLNWFLPNHVYNLCRIA